MSVNSAPLFTPINIGKLTLAGRLIKTATAETRASDEGFVTPQLIDFYLPMAKGGTPLIITGNIYASLDGKSAPHQVGADNDDKIPGLSQLVAAVHAHGSKMFAQLNHCGRQVVPRFAGLSEAVSASAKTELVTGTHPRALSVAEIKRIVELCRRCRTVQEAGFDGVQIHAANGYLMSQFLTPYTNRRSDAYGGSLEQRATMLREVFRAIRSRVGADFPIIIKMNGSDYLPLRPGLKTRELVEIAAIMEQEGADAIEVSVSHYESGFPMVRGTFVRCLRNMVREHEPPAVFPTLGIPLVLAVPRYSVQSDLDPPRRLQPALHAAVQAETEDSGNLRRRISHPRSHGSSARTRHVRHRFGWPCLHRRSASVSTSTRQ
jgi:2,4-dienoyl-CoA reductase-like NADH-dependent reductase (Old Yellow Enzyme family)